MKKIMILHKVYSIIEPARLLDSDPDMDESGADAYCDLITKVICIPRASEEGILHSPAYRQELLEHEVIHALLYESGNTPEQPGGSEELVELIRFISSYIRITGVSECL